MATLLAPEFALRDERPADFVPKDAFALELTYDLDDATGLPIFASRTLTGDSNQVETLFRGLRRVTWSKFRLREKFVASLDIRVQSDCDVYLFTDPNRELFWSTEQDAITTSADRESLYYELRYHRGERKFRRPDFPGPNCRKISFLAKLNPDGDDVDHKFNYHVRLRGLDGNMHEVLIDPDIKNPSA